MPNLEQGSTRLSSRTEAVERVLTSQRRNLITLAIRSDLAWQEKEAERAHGFGAADDIRLNKREQKRLVQLVLAVDNARKSEDQERIKIIEWELGGINVEIAHRAIEKVNPPMDRLTEKITTEKIRSHEVSEALTTTTIELLGLRNIMKPQTFGKVVDNFQLAGYKIEEARQLSKKALASTLVTPVAWFGASAMSVTGAVFFNHLSSEIISQYLPTAAVLSAFLVHGAVNALSYWVSRSNIRLLESTGFSPEINTLISHTIGKELLDTTSRSSQKNMTHLAYWLLSPRIYEEIALIPVNIANPSAAIAAHLAAAVFFGIRIAGQDITSFIAEKRKTNSKKQK